MAIPNYRVLVGKTKKQTNVEMQHNAQYVSGHFVGGHSDFDGSVVALCLLCSPAQQLI
jgi:riboflavin synthase alpha subunit